MYKRSHFRAAGQRAARLLVIVFHLCNLLPLFYYLAKKSRMYCAVRPCSPVL
jgi:hypothetical protein